PGKIAWPSISVGTRNAAVEETDRRDDFRRVATCPGGGEDEVLANVVHEVGCPDRSRTIRLECRAVRRPHVINRRARPDAGGGLVRLVRGRDDARPARDDVRKEHPDLPVREDERRVARPASLLLVEELAALSEDPLVRSPPQPERGACDRRLRDRRRSRRPAARGKHPADRRACGDKYGSRGDHITPPA